MLVEQGFDPRGPEVLQALGLDEGTIRERAELADIRRRSKPPRQVRRRLGLRHHARHRHPHAEAFAGMPQRYVVHACYGSMQRPQASHPWISPGTPGPALPPIVVKLSAALTMGRNALSEQDITNMVLALPQAKQPAALQLFRTVFDVLDQAAKLRTQPAPASHAGRAPLLSLEPWAMDRLASVPSAARERSANVQAVKG